MKGHLRERSPGHWAIVIDVRDPQSGKRKRKWHSFKGTKREAQIKNADRIAGAFLRQAYPALGGCRLQSEPASEFEVHREEDKSS
jgi:hypothetical protein